MIRFQRAKSNKATLELTPLIDVVFQLLIFFLLTSSFIGRGIPLDLPETVAAESQPKDLLVLSVNARNEIYLGDKRVTVSEIPEVIQQRFSGGETPQIALRGDRKAAYGTFMQVVDILQQKGIDQMVLVSESKED